MRNQSMNQNVSGTGILRTLALAAGIVVGLVPGGARASFFQEYCSSAETTVKMSSGHIENKLQVTERKYLNGGHLDRVRPLDQQEFEVSVVKETELLKEMNHSCPAGSQVGWTAWHQIHAREIEIRRRDGGLIDSDVVGVTPDRRQIKATLLCEMRGNGQRPCSPPTP